MDSIIWAPTPSGFQQGLDNGEPHRRWERGSPQLPPHGLGRSTAPLRAALSPGFALWDSTMHPCALRPGGDSFPLVLVRVWYLPLGALFPIFSSANAPFPKLSVNCPT